MFRGAAYAVGLLRACGRLAALIYIDWHEIAALRWVTKAWAEMLGGDPVSWLLNSDEPPARWVILTCVLDRAPTDPDALEASGGVPADADTRWLVERLPDWASRVRLSGHESPAFAPHLLNLLAHLGVRAGDFDPIEALLDAMLAHQEPSGRFPSYGVMPGRLRADPGLAAS